MYQQYTLPELAQELQRRNAAKQDFVVNTAELGFDALPAVGARASDGVEAAQTPSARFVSIPDEGVYELNRHAEKQMAERLGIPGKYWDRLAADYPDLLAQNARTIMQGEPKRQMIRTYNWADRGPGGAPGEGPRVARAFLSDRYRRLDDEQLAEHVLPILGEIPDAEFVSTGLTDTRMYLKVVAPRIQAEVKRGDVVQAGVVISNSEVGSGSLSVQPMTFRLACLNGMITSQAMRRYHVGKRAETEGDSYRVFSDETLRKDDAAFFSAVGDVVRAAVDETRFQQIVAQMRQTAERPPMEDPVRGVERLSQRIDLREGEQRGVLTHLIQGGDLTQWGLLNAVTRASQDVDDYDRATELERAGGDLLDVSAQEWAELAAA